MICCKVKLLVDSETEAFELPEFDDIYRSDSEDVGLCQMLIISLI